MRKIPQYVLVGVVGLVIAGLLRQRRRPIPTPPSLAFLFENPLVEAFAGPKLLAERLGLAPGMRVLDAGCGPGRLTIPLARAVEPSGEVVALDSQRAMLEPLEHRLEAVNTTNVRTLEAGLGEGALDTEAFDRVLLAFVLGEVRDREAAARELYTALKPEGILSVTEGFGDPDYRRSASVRREVEPAGFELVERFGASLSTRLISVGRTTGRSLARFKTLERSQKGLRRRFLTRSTICEKLVRRIFPYFSVQRSVTTDPQHPPRSLAEEVGCAVSLSSCL